MSSSVGDSVAEADAAGTEEDCCPRARMAKQSGSKAVNMVKDEGASKVFKSLSDHVTTLITIDVH